MQGKISTQDKIVNAMPFVALVAIIIVGIVFLLR